MAATSTKAIRDSTPMPARAALLDRPQARKICRARDALGSASEGLGFGLLWGSQEEMRVEV